ncbi:MAG: hypothetical protein Q9164_003026 [Protoblastenia rupestris]
MQRGTLKNHDDTDVAVQINPEDTRKSIGHETVEAAQPASKEAVSSSTVAAESHVDIEPMKPQPDDECIAIMGMTGTGKSTFISMLVNDQVTIGHGLYSTTRNLDIYRCSGIFTKTVWLIDTPGFDDTEISDADIIRDIATFLARCFETGIRLSGVIYLHRITDPRMSGSAIKNLELFKLLCGKEAFPIVYLVTTRWNELAEGSADYQEAINREMQLCAGEKFWKPMIEAGSSVLRHERLDLSSTEAIVKSILQSRRKASLAIQIEMVVQKLCLNMTSAGEFLDNAYGKAKQRYERELQEIQDSWEEAHGERDYRAMAALDAERQDLVLRTEKVLQEQKDIKTDFQELRAKKMKDIRSKSARAAHSEPGHMNRSDRAGSASHPDVDARILEPPSRQVSSKSSSLVRLDTSGDTATVTKTSRKYTPSEPLQTRTLRGSVKQDDQRAIVARGAQSVKTFFENWLYG